MTEAWWFGVLGFGEDALYVWGSYLVAVALVLVEIVLLYLRGKTILGHLGWVGGFGQPLASPQSRAGDG